MEESQTANTGARQVLPITDTVRGLLNLYKSQFAGYEDAAAAINVHKDTLARYYTASPNISLGVFQRIGEVLAEKADPEEVERILDGQTLESIYQQARPQDLSQKDHVMYRVTPELLKLLNFYTSLFPNQGAAAAALELNPRTYRAYLNGKILSFPRRGFLAMLRVLEDKGYPENSLLEICGVDNWEQVLEARIQSPTLRVNREQLTQKIARLFTQGRIQTKDVSRDIQNASSRLFGSLGKAVQASMEYLENRLAEAVEVNVLTGDFEEASEALNRLQEYVKLYEDNVDTICKAAPMERRDPWQHEINRRKERVNYLRNMYKERLKNSLKETATELGVETSQLSHEKVRAYDPEDSYALGDVITHPAYGVGRIESMAGKDKVRVRFADAEHGEKILTINQRYARPEFWSLTRDEAARERGRRRVAAN